MELFVFGLNHQSAALDLRERLAFPGEALGEALADLRLRLPPEGTEEALVSTCNRTELLLGASQPDAAREISLQWLSEHARMPLDELLPHLYIHRGPDAAEHLFRVACGLDSMVLGETQILGQLKDAARSAQELGTLGSTLHHLFQQAFSVAKHVRSQTGIGEHTISMAAASVKLAQRIFGDLSKTHMLFVGAGEMIQLNLAHFSSHNPQSITIANRTFSRAETLAQEVSGRAIPLQQLPEELHKADIVVSCTASTHPILTKSMVSRALKQRRSRPMFLADLAVPRDIEPEVREHADAYVYTVDDLAALVQEGAAARREAVQAAQALVEQGVEQFRAWLGARQQLPVLRRLTQHAESLQAQELALAQKRLAKGESPDEVMKHLARSLSQKLLHGAYSSLNHPDPDIRASAAEGVQRIFRLPDSQS